MSPAWPRAKLGDVLRLANDAVDVDPASNYEMAGVYSFGRGLFRREPLKGIDTTYKRLHRLHRDQFVISQLKAWEGALARVSDEFDGAYLSPQFQTFTAIPDLLDIRYLEWYCKQQTVWGVLGKLSRGMGARRDSVSPFSFLSLEIPLPPLDEQRRISERVACLSGKVLDIKELIDKSILEIGAVFQSALFEIFVKEATEWKQAKLSSVVTICDKQVDPTLPEYRVLPHISGENMESGTCRLLPYRTAEEDGVRSGNYHFGPDTVLYSKIRPYLRKATYVNFEGVCSAEVYPIRCNDSEISPHFLKWALIAQPFTDYANKLSGRTRMPKLNRKQFGNFLLSYPPMITQNKIAQYLDGLQAKISTMNTLQSHRADEVRALMPSILDKAFKGEL